MGPTGYGDSPYQSFSTHAGNPYFIDLNSLHRQGLATKGDLASAKIAGSQDKVDYESLYKVRRLSLYKIAGKFLKRADKSQKSSYREFCEAQQFWLDDYAHFMAIKDEREKSWQDWPAPLRKRQKKALAQSIKEKQTEISVHKTVQWFFDEQWKAVRKQAHQSGVEILGDLPIFVAADSADAWANPELFQFDKNLRPERVAGVPPDYFSQDGQLWGNPLYRWERHQKDDFLWWKDRMRSALRLYDRVRVDHFRGFSAYWSIPAGDKTARNGHWVEAPGDDLLEALVQEFPDLPMVAEDLGDITDEVRQLRRDFGLPGMKVLQFAFNEPGNSFLPHNYERNFVVYPGTHDNDTTRGWFEDPTRRSDRDFFLRYAGKPEDTKAEDAVEALIKLAMNSTADLAIIAFQDLLKLGSEARMNTPSQASGNWQWRMSPEDLTTALDWLRETTWLSGRAP